MEIQIIVVECYYILNEIFILTRNEIHLIKILSLSSRCQVCPYKVTYEGHLLEHIFVLLPFTL